MSVMCDNDGDEDDIFIVKRKKPIGRLTKQKAFEIKKKVLHKENCNFSGEYETVGNSRPARSENGNSMNTSRGNMNEKRKRDDGDDYDISMLEERVTSATVDNSRSGTPGKIEMKTPTKNISTPKKSLSKLITHYFSPRKLTSSNMSTDESSAPSDLKDVENGKKVKCAFLDEKPVCPSKLQAVIIQETNFHDSNIEDGTSLMFADSSSSMMDDIKKTSGKYCYSYNLKGILHHEVSNQTLLQQKMLAEGKEFESLITADELFNVINFLNMPENAIELFTRMLCRKKGWHRISKISYENIEGNVEEIFKVLNDENYVDFDVEKESIETMLKLLKKSEIQKLSARFNITLKGAGNTRGDFISGIVKSEKSQKSVYDMWMKGGRSKKELLKDEITKALGPCMRLNKTFLSLFNRFLLLFSLPHYTNNNDLWSSQIYMMGKVHMKAISFPSYTVKATVIFESRNDLIFYEEAVELMSQFDEALLNKNNEEFFAIGQKAKMEFKQLLENEGFKNRVRNLPPFLRRFNAGAIYARILTYYCEKFKKNKDRSEVVEIMKMLINQDVFSVSKKGQWYNLLVIAYTDMGKLEEAGSTLLAALRENEVNEVEKLMLQLRGQNLLRKKKNGLKWKELRDELDDACITDVADPPKVEIRRKALDESRSGSKTVYMFKHKSGEITFSSVEETVINHYKNNGFTKGVHDEGSIIKTLYCSVFFDIIYKLSPAGVFQNEYQSEPLDFQSSSFYSNRKTDIDSRLQELRTWSMDRFENFISQVYAENFGCECVIDWKVDNSVLCEVLKCLGTQEFASICERLVQNFRIYKSGFPDLTVWNPSTGKCKFVEVKSPNDKLSPNQRLWLDYLRNLNVDCEVCNVKNIASM